MPVPWEYGETAKRGIVTQICPNISFYIREDE